MKRALITLLLLIFISGCVGPVQPHEQYRKGTKAIVLSFIKNAPPSKVFDTDKFIVGVEAKNMGAETARGVDFYLNGYDTKIITIDNKKSIGDLSGKADIFNPYEGESAVVVFKQHRTDLGDADTYKPTFMVTACYGYKTIAQAEVCINGNPTFNVGVCTVSDVSLSGGQGAPVGVTKIEVAATPGKTNFKIHIKNFGPGGPCVNERVSELEKVSVESVKVHNEPLKKCKPLDGGKLRLINGQAVLYCDMGVDPDAVYTTPIVIILSYDYSTTITKSVEIIKAPS